MKTEIKEQWVKALRSGEYKQGVGLLNKNQKLCCLGVLCELAVKAGVPVLVSFDKGFGCTAYDDATEMPPKSVADWAGTDRSPKVQHGVEYAELSALNDRGHSFNMIADLIEAQL
jgi:hypothetical protein